MSTHQNIWKAVETVLLAHHHEPDLEAARVLYSAFAAHRLSGQPVWPMVVAPPGSCKTELLEALDGLPNLHLIDKITPNTFLSGQIDDPKKARTKPASLLHRIGKDGIIIYSDFSTVLSMHREHRASILADMRRIYDGRLRREFGTAQHLNEREWKGRITFGVAATPDVDRHYAVFQTLGERFVMIRWPRPGGIEAALRAMNQDRKQAKKDLQEAVHSLFRSLPDIHPSLNSEMQLKVAALTEFVVRARTHVPRNGYSKDVIYVPEPEAATRLAQQLAQLGKGSALIAGRDTVTEDDLVMVRRAGLDCIPATRRRILDGIRVGKNAYALNLPDSTVNYAVEDLQSQELLAGSDKLSSLSENLLLKAGIR